MSKRKADDISADEDAEPSAAADGAGSDRPVLPATCLASVLNFLPYSDVRTCLLAGKAIAIDAAKHIETLNILEPAGLDVPASRRFASASEVNVMCLIKYLSPEDTWVLSRDAATRTALFLTHFPHLKRAFVGGTQRYTYSREDGFYGGMVTLPDDHAAIFRGLVESFCAAFKARSLPHDLDVKGVLGGGTQSIRCEPVREAAESPCRLCRGVCKTFPLDLVLNLLLPEDYGDEETDICLSDENRLKAVLTRPDATDFIKSERATMFLLDTVEFDSCELGEKIVKRMEQLGAKPGLAHLIYNVHDFTFERIERLVSAGINPRRVSKEDLYKRKHMWKGRILDRATFNRLVAMGFAFDCKDFVLVDMHGQ